MQRVSTGPNRKATKQAVIVTACLRVLVARTDEEPAMTRKMRERLAKNAESVRMALSEQIRNGTVNGGIPHVPMTAYRNLAPKGGFNTRRCS